MLVFSYRKMLSKHAISNCCFVFCISVQLLFCPGHFGRYFYCEYSLSSQSEILMKLLMFMCNTSWKTSYLFQCYFGYLTINYYIIYYLSIEFHSFFIMTRLKLSKVVCSFLKHYFTLFLIHVCKMKLSFPGPDVKGLTWIQNYVPCPVSI